MTGRACPYQARPPRSHHGRKRDVTDHDIQLLVIGICIDEYYAGLREDGDAGAESRSADSGEQ